MATYYVDEHGNITKQGESKKKKKKTSATYTVELDGTITRNKPDDIAPVKPTVTTSTEDRTWFKGGGFDDGYQFGDLSKTFYGSTRDLKQSLWEGVLGIGEKVVDAGAYVAGGVGKLVGADGFADRMETFIRQDLINEEKVAHFLIGDIGSTGRFDIEGNSVFGEKTDSLVQSAGQLGATVGLQAVGVPWYLTTGATSFGGEAESAFKQDATYGEAGLSAAITAGAEILTEKISGGIKFGGKALDDGLTRELARRVSNQTVRTLTKLGMDAVGEGAEEVLSGVMSAIGQKLTYADDKQLNELFSSEDALEAFIGGAVLGGGMTGLNIGKNALEGKGRDVTSGLTANEQQVVDKVYEDRVAEKEKSGKVDEKAKRKIYDEVLSDLDRGGIDIDTIEEVLGGETYSNYKKLADAEAKMQSEYDALGKKEKYTLADDARYKELGERLKYVREKGAKNEMRKRLDDEVSSMVKDSRLSESFAERSRRSQAFEADLTQYDEKQRAIVQKAAESGILNNTRRTHDFVDLVAKIGAEKGITFDFANNAKLKESGFAVEGKTVNGYVTKDGITVNIQSAKALDTVVGHEITHVLEGTELYAELQTAAIEYAKTKGDYQGRYDALAKMYESVKDADIDAELTADIVGEYLFTDTDFINNLSANHRNVFQKIYDEIKYLLKVATAGSKEARQLEQVKRAFEKAYRDGGKNTDNGGVKYSVYSRPNFNSGEWSIVNRKKHSEFANPKFDLDTDKKWMYSTEKGHTVFAIYSKHDVEDPTVLYGSSGKKAEQDYAKLKKFFEEGQRYAGNNRATFDRLLNDIKSAKRNASDGISPAGERGTTTGDVFLPFGESDSNGRRDYGNGAENLQATLTEYNDEASDDSGASFVTFGNDYAAVRNFMKDGDTSEEAESGAEVKYSLVEDQGTIDFLENQEHLTVYKAMALVDGKLYPPMASQTYVEEEYTTKSGEKKTRRVRKLKNPSVLGRWQQAEERTDIAEQTFDPKKGYSSFDLLKSNGKTTGGVAYNPYEHTSNIVLNDQFSEAYQRPELVTVEYEIPVSELTSGYKAQYAKDPVGLTDWKAGGVAQKLQHGHRDVYLTRWSKPVRVLSDAEVAQKYKEILDKEEGISVPWNVVTASLREELEKIGVPIDYSDIKAGSTVRSFEAAVRGDYEKPKKAKKAAKYSLASDSEGRQLAPGVAKRFANSKVVDENGDLRVVYHGTTYGEFSVFSKEHGNVENDFGVGFYFSSSDADVSEHYDGGGPDFENKVARRAEQIEQEEDIDYEEAEQRAREELFRGGHKFEVYLNIENPAIVGETTLFSQDEALEEYDEEDYDDYDDYIADVEQAVADKIESIVWDVERKTSAYSVDGLSEVLFEAYYEGGIGIEELKAKVNELYLEDENGNFIGNEVVRQIIESLGYDGIIDPTVSGKWNMDMEEGTTHYIAFRPEQIKAVTNETPTDNPDIHRSLSPEGARPAADGNYGRYHVYGRDIALETAEDIAPVAAPADIAPVQTEAAAYEEPAEESHYAELDRLTEQAEALERQMYEAMDAGDNEKAMEINADLVDAAMRITELEQQLDADVQERLASMEDADAPVVREAPYSESTDTVTLPKKTVQDIAKDARAVLGFSPRRSAEMRELIEKFSQGEIDSEQLHGEIAQRFHTITEKGRLEDVAEVRNWLRRARLNVTDDIKSEYTDYLNEVYKPNRGRILFAKDGADVDQFYAEASSLYPGFFPADIINPADQLQRIVEVANMDINTEQSYELDQELLESVTDNIIRGVNEYRSTQRLKMSEQDARAAFNGLMADADRYAPPTEEDIAPVRAAVMQPAQESVPTAKQPIKTVKERLEAKLQNLQTELKNNLLLREESRADYELEILQAQTAYNALENKNTQKANTLLRRVERLRRISSNEDARYAKRISDLETQVDKANEELRTGESTEAQGAMRQELHQRIVENIRAKFAERGYDLETVLKNAKDLSTFATVDNTPQRVMEKALGYKEGQILSDLTVNQVAENETKGIRWLNGYTDRKNGLLAQISKQYGIKPGSKESAAAQMYAEGFYVAENDDIIEYGDRELAADFPDAKVQENIKGLARDPRIRQIYDATLAMINESRARNAYPEIQKLDNYFLHFRAMDDTFSRLGIPFNPNDIKAKDLPTDLNGVTADLKPGQPYFASAMHRKGKRTSFDLLGGLERYLTSAKGQIYHIDDIQTLRALRNHIAETYGQAHGLDGLDAMTEEEAAAQIEQVYDAHLSTFAKFLNEEANVIAGKTALIDRGLEGIIGRRGMTFFDTLNRQVGANMVGFNVSSSLTNFIAPVQAFAKTNKAAFVKGFAQTVANRIGSIAGKGDGFAENNPTMIRRQGADRFYRTPWQKAGDLGYALMGAVDSLSTEIIVRGKYNELVSKGMSHEQAVTEADKWTSRLMGDRSLGQMPQLYNSKMLGLITKFQLEVRNQLDSQFYDTIQEAKVSAEDIQNKQKRNAKVAAQVASTFVQLAVVQHLFGKAFEAVAGYNPAFDIIEAIVKAFGWDDEEESEDTALDNLGQGFMSLLEDMPYSSVATGGRIPISSALPVAQFIKGKDQYGNEKSRLETVAETAPYWLLPGGYGQIKKTTQGLGMFDEDLPIAGSYTDSGNLRYPVEDTLANRVQAAVFGQYASGNARDYFDNERQSLKKNQIQELVDVDIPIREYWDYRAGLNEQETLADKFDYIADLDLPIDKKNILINNVVDRKEAVDLADYDDYANYEEFDFAVKNPEKYDFLQSVGVSVAEYQSFDDDTKDAYNWAYENPDKYMVSRAVTDDVAVYRQYTKALNDITADKDSAGKSISGSRKTKVINYLNNLDADYYTKIILFKMEYNADDTYNREIIEYLNGRNDISFEEEVTILKELGFTVTADGTVRW